MVEQHIWIEFWGRLRSNLLSSFLIVSSIDLSFGSTENNISDYLTRSIKFRYWVIPSVLAWCIVS